MVLKVPEVLKVLVLRVLQVLRVLGVRPHACHLSNHD
jgi:hypothetical protein